MAFDEGYTLGEDFTASRSWLGKGFAAIENTAKAMVKIIRQFSGEPKVRDKATSIVYHVGDKDQWSEVKAIYDWVRENTRYVRDPNGLETIHSPILMLEVIDRGYMFQGDCDDLTALTLSLLKAVGYPVKVRIVSYVTDPSRYKHVFGIVNIKGQWVPIEPIAKDVELGWQSPGIAKVKDYNI